MKKDRPEWMNDGRSSILYSINLNIRALLPKECVSYVPLLRAKDETLWLAKLAKSSHEATADGSSGFISAAIAKPISANTTTESSVGPYEKRKDHLTRKLRERELGCDLEGAKITLNCNLHLRGTLDES